MSEKKVTYIYSYTGSVEYSFSNVILDDKNRMQASGNISGYEGIDAIPYDGATVTMKADASGATDQKDFDPPLNNRLFYLVTDEVYTEDDYDTIVSLATEIYPTLVSGEFVATFVFNNPNNYSNLYLFWDYRNNLDEGTVTNTASDFEKYIEVNLGDNVGRSGVYYDITDVPARIKIMWNDVVVADTGYVGLNSLVNYNALISAGVSDDDINLVEPYDGLVNNGTSTLLFNKYSSLSNAVVKVESPLSSVSFLLETVLPSLKSFYIDTTNGTIDDVCDQCPTTVYYHDGIGTRPVEGDRIYTDADGTGYLQLRSVCSSTNIAG
jgi:hypothetical protein